MHERVTADLVIDVLVMAISRRDPTGVIIHPSAITGPSTRRCASRTISRTNGLVASFGSVCDADHNAAMEAFWATLNKRELAWIHRRPRWSSRAELRAATLRLHRDFLQPGPVSSRPRSPHPSRGLRRHSRWHDQPKPRVHKSGSTPGGWPARPDDSGTGITAPFNAPTLGPPPWFVYEVKPRTATAVGTAEDTPGSTRWRF